MKLSAAAELAVRGILVLAERFGEGPVTLDTICAQRDLPKQYLTKIFAQLARSGLVMPVRGKGGGYMLARVPKSITLLEIIESVEGPLVLNLCQHEPPKCDDHLCRIRDVWSDLQKIVRTRLSETTLGDCLRDPAAPASAMAQEA